MSGCQVQRRRCSRPQVCDREGLPPPVAVARGVEGLAAPDRRQRLQQADARGRLRRQHHVRAPRQRRRGLSHHQTLPPGIPAAISRPQGWDTGQSQPFWELKSYQKYVCILALQNA